VRAPDRGLEERHPQMEDLINKQTNVVAKVHAMVFEFGVVFCLPEGSFFGQKQRARSDRPTERHILSSQGCLSKLSYGDAS